jgi:hypothetical protein
MIKNPITLDEAAALSGLHHQKLRRLLISGKLEGEKVNRHTKGSAPLERDSLLRLMEQLKANPKAFHKPNKPKQRAGVDFTHLFLPISQEEGAVIRNVLTALERTRILEYYVALKTQQPENFKRALEKMEA